MVSEVGDVVFPQRPNLDNAGNQQVSPQQPEALQGTTPTNEVPFWQRALSKVIGNKTRSLVAAAAITTGMGGAAHVATEGATTEKALDVAGQVITPPSLDTTLGIKTDEDRASQGNSVDAVKNVFGDGGRMVVGGVKDAADKAAGQIKDGGSVVGATARDAILSEEFQQGWQERSLMGKPIEGERVIEAELVPVIGSNGEEIPIFVRTKPSQGGERKELKDVNIDPKRVEGIVVYGAYVGGKSAVDGLQVSTWLKMKGMEDGKPIDVYVSGLTYKPLPEEPEQSK